MSLPDPPSMEALARYAERFNASATLQYFDVRIEFPDPTKVCAIIDPVPDAQRGGLGSQAINGGVLAALFDLVIGCSAALVDPTRRAATIQLSMQFEQAVTGDRVVAEAWLNRAGRTNVFASAHILDADGKACCHGQGVVRISSQPWSDGGSPAVN